MTRIKAWLAVIGVFITALVASYFGGRKSAQTDAKIDNMKREAKTHDRLTRADVGRNLTDDERRQRLRDFAKRNGG